MSRDRARAPRRKKARPPASVGAVRPERAEGPARLVTTEVLQELRVSGPLPPPEVLRGYDDALPGAAERILRMAEIDQADAREANRLAIREAAADSRHGQKYALRIALAARTAACVLGYRGHETAAATVGGGTVVGLVAVFIAGRRGRGS